MSLFSVKNFLSHGAEKLRRVTPLCCVPEIFWFRRTIRRRGGGTRFSRRKVFVSQCRKKNIGEPIRVSSFLGVDKFYASEG